MWINFERDRSIAYCPCVKNSEISSRLYESPRRLNIRVVSTARKTDPGHLPALANRRRETRPPSITTFGAAWMILLRQLSTMIAYPKSISGALQALYSCRKRFQTLSARMTRGKRSFPVHSWADLHQACKNISRELRSIDIPEATFICYS